MLRILTVLTLVLCLAAFAPLATAAPTSNALAIPVTGTGAGTFVGTFNLTNFTVQGNQLFANGILTGTLTNGSVVQSVLQTVSLLVNTTSSTASCTILHLVIGPINLDLLGLTITTNQIVLDISAVPGPGNLLGNLLCSVANLLNNPNQTLANLLNQIIGILRGL